MKKSILRKLAAAIMAAALMFCAVVPALAETPEEESFYYVSLGDSIAAGYDIDGDKSSLNDSVLSPKTNYKSSPASSYPAIFAGKLEQAMRNSGYTGKFEWSNLATIGFTGGDLLSTLTDEEYIGELYQWLYQVRPEYFPPEKTQLHDLYVEEIKKADLITLHIGANDLLVRTVMELLNHSSEDGTENPFYSTAAYVIISFLLTGMMEAESGEDGDSTFNVNSLLDKLLAQYDGDVDALLDDVEELLSFLSYSNMSEMLEEFTVKALLYYQQIIEEILKLNPDVEIICVGQYQPFGKDLEYIEGHPFTLPGLLTDALDSMRGIVEAETSGGIIVRSEEPEIIPDASDLAPALVRLQNTALLGEEGDDIVSDLTTLDTIIASIREAIEELGTVGASIEEVLGMIAEEIGAFVETLNIVLETLKELYEAGKTVEEFLRTASETTQIVLRLTEALLSTLPADFINIYADFIGTPADYAELAGIVVDLPYWESVIEAFNEIDEDSEAKKAFLAEEENILTVVAFHLLFGKLSMEPIRELNSGIAAIAEGYGFTYVDIYDIPNELNTNPHPNADGHAFIANALIGSIAAAVEPEIEGNGTLEFPESVMFGTDVEIRILPAEGEEILSVTVDGVPVECEQGMIVVPNYQSNTVISVKFTNNAEEHQVPGIWSFDSEAHWHDCSCGEKVDRAEHTWNEGRLIASATHAEEGIMRYTCTVCGCVHDEVIPKTDDAHSFGKWETVRKTSWMEDGIERRVCGCGTVEEHQCPAYIVYAILAIALLVFVIFILVLVLLCRRRAVANRIVRQMQDQHAVDDASKDVKKLAGATALAVGASIAGIAAVLGAASQAKKKK